MHFCCVEINMKSNCLILISPLSLLRQYVFRPFIKLSYVFHAKQEISDAYTNVPAKMHVDYFISMSVCRSVAQFRVRKCERTIKASDLRFATKCRH